MTGAPAAHAVLVIDAGMGGYEGDLCDLGAVSFTVENTGGSLLDLNAGAGGPTATVNLFTQQIVSADHAAPWHSLEVLPGNFLQITATTENADTTDRTQQVFFGRITEVIANQPTPNRSGIVGFERTWTVRATNLAVDLGEHPVSGTSDLSGFESVTARCVEILGRAGSWWPIVPVYADEGSWPSVIDKVGTVNLADFAGTVQGELDRTVSSTWSWYSWARDPWRFGYSTAYRSLMRIVPRDSSIWRPAPIPGRSHFPLGYACIWFGHYFEEYELCPLPGYTLALDNASYLYGIHAKPTDGFAFLGAVPYDITGDDTWGSREQTFDGWIGSRTGHGAPESGTPPTGDAGWVVATAWADSTSVERMSVSSCVFPMTDSQYHNGLKLDIDRLDAMAVQVDDAVIPMRVRAVRITAAPHDWRVGVELERVDWVTTYDLEDYDF